MVSPTVMEYVYYRCSKKRGKCSQKYLPDKGLEKQMNEYLSKIEISDKLLGWTLKHLKKAHMLESQQREVITDKQQKDVNGISRKLDRLLEMRMNEEVTQEEYSGQKKILQENKSRLLMLQEQTAERQKNWLVLTEQTFNFARYARHWFSEGDNKKKREIIQALGSNFILKDKKLSIETAIPFSVIERGLSAVETNMAWLEPKKCGSTKGKGESFDSPNPAWLPKRVSNLWRKAT